MKNPKQLQNNKAYRAHEIQILKTKSKKKLTEVSL